MTAQRRLAPAGCPRSTQGTVIPVHLLYPSDAPSSPVAFGPYALDLARDAAVVGARLPVVAVSHGQTSTPWSHRGLATHLARAGCAVVLIEHPGDSRRDPGLAGTAANLANRPRHVRLALDAAFADAALGPALALGRVAVIGHSIGGYTALACAGGRALALPNQTADGVARPVAIVPDPRVVAVALLAPALPWLMAPDALADVRAKIYARAGALDELAPPYVIERILRGLPPATPLNYRVIPAAATSASSRRSAGAGAAGLRAAHDPPGFDRAAYQARLADELTAFLRAALTAA
ncbi:MAG: alpha/beta hydrolase [Myxococcales bacterium]|nr:alpha/beta hydrolase [Myxococcales bacterium]